LVSGAVGIVGKHVIIDLENKPEWEIIAVSRRSLDFPSRAKHVSADLLNKDDMIKNLSEDLKCVTHIFFAAYQEKPTLAEQIPPNLAMLRNLVEAVEELSPSLQHVSLIEGTKWYGPHLGPCKTPFKEDDPRYMPPNFYYDQEDYLVSRVKGGAKWAWSALRPNPVCGIAFGNPMNLVTGIAVYASVCKELGLPLRFPGTPGCWTTLLEVVDATLLGNGLVWAATTPKCANEAFNFSNGDVIRWCNVWPHIAKFFDLPIVEGPIQNLKLSDMMADKEELWKKMQQKYKLRNIPYKDLALWGFVDWVFSRDYDWFADVNKARRFGYTAMTIDSTEMFLCLFKKMREEKLIP